MGTDIQIVARVSRGPSWSYDIKLDVKQRLDEASLCALVPAFPEDRTMRCNP